MPDDTGNFAMLAHSRFLAYDRPNYYCKWGSPNSHIIVFYASHTCQPEMTENTEIFRLGLCIAPTVPPCPDNLLENHELVLVHVNSQHDDLLTFYLNKE